MKTTQCDKYCFLISLLTIGVVSVAQATTQYRISGLGTAQGFVSSTAIGINNQCNTVASSGDPYDELLRGFYNLKGCTATDIPFLPGYFGCYQ